MFICNPRFARLADERCGAFKKIEINEKKA